MEHPESIVRELTTKDSDEYIFFPVTTGSLQFQVKASNDACVLLSLAPDGDADTSVEFNIGCWKNTVTSIRKHDQINSPYLNHNTPDILSKDEFRGFWITWCGGIMHFGLEGQNFPICNIEHPEPFPVFFVGLCTAWGATGTWKIEGMPELNTPDKHAYIFRPIVAGSVEFEFRGARSCQIALTPGPTITDAMCGVILNSEENAKSSITYSTKSGNYMMLCQVERKTPKIFGGECFQPFVIKWRKGLTKVCNSWYTYNDPNPTIMEMENPSQPSFNITHFGVRTTNGASGSWRISTIETQMA